MNWQVRKRTVCRACTAGDLRCILHFPNMPLTDDFVPAERRGAEFLADLNVYLCRACGLVQTLHDIQLSQYYRDYGYTVSTSPFAQQFMRRLAERCYQRFTLRPGDRVIEVGCGDGFLLSCFRARGARVLGFEPSHLLAAAARAAGVDVRPCLFDEHSVRQIAPGLLPVQLFLLTYTFDHLPEPRRLLEATRSILDPQRGVLVIEVHDLDMIVRRRETCLFEHEHSVYLNRASMTRLLTQAGLELLTTELLPDDQRRANSLLVAAALPAAGHERDRPQERARAGGPDSADMWDDFADQARAACARVRHYVRARVAAGKRLAGYGAGGRGVMTLAQAGLTTDDIAFLCDRNRSIYGLYTPASHVLVVPPEHLLVDPVDELIVFSYGYLVEIRAELGEYEKRGGRLVSLLDLLR